MAIAPFFVTPQRESVCDFTVPVFSDYQAILMQRPRLQSDVTGFVKPFSAEVRAMGWQHDGKTQGDIRAGGTQGWTEDASRKRDGEKQGVTGTRHRVDVFFITPHFSYEL